MVNKGMTTKLGSCTTLKVSRDYPTNTAAKPVAEIVPRSRNPEAVFRVNHSGKIVTQKRSRAEEKSCTRS